MRVGCLMLILVSLILQATQAADWVRAGVNTNQPVYGLRGGLLWAVAPGGFRARSEPRGLIRLGYPILTNGGYDLVNFIAVEPVVKGRKGFSELEHSQLDDTQGKRFWAVGETNAASSGLVPGALTPLPSGAEQLEVTVAVEPFENGAKVRLVISQRSDAPDEIKLTIHAEPGSTAMAYCILTATMGNMARTRQLWLADEMISSLKLYADHRSADFAPHTYFARERLARTAEDDVLVAVTTDEADPASVFPFPGSRLWHYGGFKVTQYWKKPRETVRGDMHAAVNARYTYWRSRQPIPGGVSFENFELRERFYDGQSFIFGITRKTPAELGIGAAAP
ncbi:MAG: hypothetical protein IH623_25600 [Verrucomicrobia bacterium]|nr:hypothetical protein [Verrucomicrobiota bacterium]